MKKQEEIVGKNLLEEKGIEEASPAEKGIKEDGEDLAPQGKEQSFKINGNSTMNAKRGFPLFRSKKRIVLTAIVALFLFLAGILAVPGFFAVRAGQQVLTSVDLLGAPLAAQDLGQIKTGIEKVEADLAAFNRTLIPLSWARILPVVGGYVSDAKNGAEGGIAALEVTKKLIPTLEPYADILGFGGAVPKPAVEAGGEGAQTAEERIDFIVKALPVVTPKFGEVGPGILEAKNSLLKIDANRYPEEFRGKPLRRTIKDIQGAIVTFSTLVTDGKPLLEAAPYLLGMDNERTYLVVFQNDKELRPTGGFTTAYSLLKVKGGKIQPVSSDDIYNLDKRYRPTLDAPKPFIEHIKQPYSVNPGWRLRDMNWSPDFKTAMDLFLAEAKRAKLKDVDGVIAVDTNLLVSLLEVTGRIGVPGQGNFSAETDKRCDCPQVIYELESYADVEKPIVWDPNTGKIVFGEIVDNRKEILGPLVNSVIANAMAQPKEKVPQLAQRILSNLMEKHVIFYMFDEKTQEALESFNVAGRVTGSSGDYLQIVDANLGGRKANLYAVHEVVDEIEDKGGKVVHNLTITYKNPQKHDGWLNSVLPNFMRIYVPKGAKLISSDGAQIETTEDLGKTVFAGFFELRPEGVVKVNLKYEVPKTSPYKILVQKQPGKGAFNYTISYKGRNEEFQLATDKEIHLE